MHALRPNYKPPPQYTSIYSSNAIAPLSQAPFPQQISLAPPHNLLCLGNDAVLSSSQVPAHQQMSLPRSSTPRSIESKTATTRVNIPLLNPDVVTVKADKGIQRRTRNDKPQGIQDRKLGKRRIPPPLSVGQPSRPLQESTLSLKLGPAYRQSSSHDISADPKISTIEENYKRFLLSKDAHDRERTKETPRTSQADEHNQIISLKVAVENLQGPTTQVIEDMENMKKEDARLKKHIKKMEREYKKSIDGAVDRLKKRITSLEDESKSRQEKIDQLEESYTRMKSERDSLTVELWGVKNELQGLQTTRSVTLEPPAHAYQPSHSHYPLATRSSPRLFDAKGDANVSLHWHLPRPIAASHPSNDFQN